MPQLQLGVSDAALMACSDGAYGELGLVTSGELARQSIARILSARSQNFTLSGCR